MPEIEDCRKCGICCFGCIFLEHNEKTDLFKCLIYTNKHRDNSFQKNHFDNIEQIERNIKHFIMLEEDDCKPCHDYKCGRIKRLDVVWDKHDLSIREIRIEECKKIQEIRKSIPDFNVLVEVLK